jgi:hypothetical protein
MENISNFVLAGFILTTLATVGLFYKATKSKFALLFICLWMGVTAILGSIGFYRVFDAFPPRFVFLLPLGLLFVIVFSFTTKGKKFMQNTDNKWLTLLHIVRIPVEIVLYYVFLAGLIPDLMTFEGYNFDIISGISAPIIFYFYFVNRILSKRLLLLWNFACLGLLTNILTIALLSAKTPFQQLAFHQPNIGVTYFPFVWLPAVIVPIVLFSHLTSIFQLLKGQESE